MFADVTSANVVGYNGDDSHGGLNWYTPTFRTVGCNTTDINSINLDDGQPAGEGMVGWGETMYIVDPNGEPDGSYIYWNKGMDMTGTVETDFFWADEEGTPVSVSFDAGDGIAIENGIVEDFTEYKIKNAGEVDKGTVTFAAHGGLNWTGNPFPMALPINNITLDDGQPAGEGMVGWGETMYIVDPNGEPEGSYIYWNKGMDMTGTVETDFFWADGEGNPVDVSFDPGAGFAIENGIVEDFTEYDIKIACPYSL